LAQIPAESFALVKRQLRQPALDRCQQLSTTHDPGRDTRLAGRFDARSDPRLLAAHDSEKVGGFAGVRAARARAMRPEAAGPKGLGIQRRRAP
jgi:hypothetical protein